MQFHQWAIAIATATLLSVPGTSILAMDIQVGNIRVQTAPNGELYVDTPRGRIYLPPEDDYYEDGDYYEDDYDYDDYCDGGQVVQRQVQRSSSGRQESYSSVYTRGCR